MPRKTKILVRRKTAGGRTKARVPVTRSHTRNAKGPKSKKKSGRRSRRTRSRSAKGASPPRYRNGDPDTNKDIDTNIVIKDIRDRTGPPPETVDIDMRHIIREGDKLFTTLFVNKKFIGSIGSHPKKGTFLNADQTLVSYDGTFEVEIERVTTAGTSTSG